MPPDAFGPFRVLHQIGAGTLGPVFRAYDPDGDRLVAVKLFSLELPPERVHQLVATLEALVAAIPTCPGIVRPVATGMSGLMAYLAQDYVVADSLDVSLRETGPLAVSEALRVAEQLAAALDEAAVAGVVHGTLHPRDVLMVPDQVRVTGLGVARALEGVGIAAPVRRPYAAPERVAGTAWDGRADVYALAALAHELLWGRRLAGTSADATASLPGLPGCDASQLRAAFASALSEDPEARSATASAFAARLREACVGGAGATAAARPARGRSAAPRRARAPSLPLEARPDAGPEAGMGRLLDKADAGEDAPKQAPEDAHVDAVLDAAAQGPAAPAIDDALSRRHGDSGVAPLEVRIERDQEPGIGPAVEHALPPAGTLTEIVMRETWQPPRRGAASPAGAGELSITPQPAVLVAPDEGTGATRRGRGALRQIAAALGVGVVLGFAAGYRAGSTREPAAPPAQVPAGVVSAPPTDVPRAEVLPAAPVVQPQMPGAAAASPSRAVAAEAAPTQEPSGAAPSSVERGASRVTSLTIDSKPRGARVFVDGRPAGTTPLVLTHARAGTHAVRVVRAGYRPWSATVRVRIGRATAVTASLRR
ncbi:MAG: PEGA domain-containing protein [Acidobacteriota bacterium]